MSTIIPRYDIFIRYLEAGDFIEDFLIAAVVTILSVRFFLHITGYPQIGGGNFHIAHMLYGGILMMITILLLISFLDKQVKQIAAILGGIGFGLFIDELGKFVTRDNNYFFEPTIGLVYVIFIFLFLAIRATEHFVKITPVGYAVNAFEVMKEVVIYDLDRHEKRKALQYLKKAEKNDPAVRAMIKLLESTQPHPPKKEHLISIIHKKLSKMYTQLLKSNYFSTGVVVVFIIQSMWGLYQAIFHLHSSDSFFEVGLFISSILSGLFVIFGTYYFIRNERFSAYNMYRYAILIDIFLTQFYLFYLEQLSAVVQLVWSIIIYITLRFLITQELRIEKDDDNTLMEKIKAVFT